MMMMMIIEVDVSSGDETRRDAVRDGLCVHVMYFYSVCLTPTFSTIAYASISFVIQFLLLRLYESYVKNP